MNPKNPLEKCLIGKTAEETCQIALETICTLTLEFNRSASHVSWAISGGKTPKKLYQALAKQNLPWDNLDLFLVDERNVGFNDPQSNFGMIQASGLTSHISTKHLHRMQSGELSIHSAQLYSELIYQHCPGGVLDVVILGMGADGHTASLFPGTTAASKLDQNTLVIAHEVPILGNAVRQSLSFECLLRAKHVIFYILGKDKRPALQEIFGHASSSLPTALLRRWRLERGQAITWIVDIEAMGDSTL